MRKTVNFSRRYKQARLCEVCETRKAFDNQHCHVLINHVKKEQHRCPYCDYSTKFGENFVQLHQQYKHHGYDEVADTVDSLAQQDFQKIRQTCFYEQEYTQKKTKVGVSS